MQVDVCDELDFAVGWSAREAMARTGHALAAGGRVWLVDPVDGEGVEERVRALGKPAGVIQLLDRHARDSVPLARRLGVPHHVVPVGPLPGVPFEFLPVVDRRFWRESALWWPGPRLLACGDALGTVGYFRSPGEAIGLHPLLRLRPPRWLADLEPQHVLCGHGAGLHGPDTAAEVRAAMGSARRGLATAWVGLLRSGRGR